MSEAKINIAGNGAEVLRTLKNIEKGFAGVTTSISDMARTSAASEKAGDKMLTTFSTGAARVGRDIASIFTGLLSVQAFGRLMMAEYEKFKQQMTTSADVGTQYNAALQAAYKNAPSGMSINQLDVIAKSVSQKRGIGQIQVAQAMAPTLAAGQLNASQIEDVLSSAVPLAGGAQPEYEATSAITAGFMAKMPGRNLTASQVAGFLQKASGGSAVDKFSLYGPEASKVASAAIAQGLQPEEMIAVFNAITRGISDDSGEVSRTAAISLGGMLSGQAGAMKLGTNSPKQIIAAIMGQNPGAISDIVDKIEGREQTKDFVKSMFQGGGVGQGFLERAFADTPSFATGQQTYDEMAAGIAASPYTASARGEQAIAAAAQREALRPERVAAGQYAGGLSKYRAAMGGSALGDWLDEKGFEAAIAQGRDPTETMIGNLENQASGLRRTQYRSHGYGMPIAIPPSAENVQRASETDELISVLKEIRINLQAVPVAPNGETPAIGKQLSGAKK